MVKDKKLIVIDGNAVIHRAFHALPPLTSKKGEVVNAVYGFMLVFFRALKEFSPDMIIVVFDAPGPTFRHKKYKEYKAKRPKAPNELYEQIPKIKEIIKNFNIPIFEKQGYEADDVIGAIAKKVKRIQIFPKIETIILSGDLDILQLVDDKTKAFILRKGVKDAVLYGRKEVREKYEGLEPEQLIDYRALRGDPSDNIPGVTGIGEKTAISLLKNFNSLANLYFELENKTEKAKKLNYKLKEKLLKYKEQAFISYSLAKIRDDVAIDLNLNKSWKGKYNKQKLIKLFKKYDFKTLVPRLSEIGDAGVDKKRAVALKEKEKSGKKMIKKTANLSSKNNNLSLF